jgi:hypothetical protein
MNGLSLRFGWMAVAAIAADVAALASIWRSRAHSTKAQTIWTIIVLLVPLAGAAAWAFLGRERRRVR